MLLKSLLVLATCAVAQAGGGPLVFERSKLGDVTFEAASACDINNDGKFDVVTGEYWFEGPEFKRAHKICTLRREDDYYDDFSDFPTDVNGDGYVDIISGGWWGATLVWRENPKGKPVEWTTHEIDKTGPVETTRFWDVDGDGQLEACPNAGGRVAVYKLVRDAAGKGTAKFEKHVIKEGGCGHGLGFGDVNGDGRGDFIVPDGWIEAPQKPYEQEWKWHPELRLGNASVPILVYDVNGDGKGDLIVGQAHPYGLSWWEQGTADGKRTWTEHVIDPDRSQYHDLILADIDNDGKLELITGKRFRAHAWHDPGSRDPIGVYYFELEGTKFIRHTIDYGPAGKAAGAGIYMWLEDLNGDGWKDLITPGKSGVYVFMNRGRLEK